LDAPTSAYGAVDRFRANADHLRSFGRGSGWLRHCASAPVHWRWRV
jgi:hypothetical protein